VSKAADVLTASQAAKDLMQLFLKWYYPQGAGSTASKDQYLARGLVCTPYLGESYHGPRGPAGWVVCVNGSPPKGTLVLLGRGPPSSAYFLGPKCKHVSGRKQIRVIKSFCECHLKGRKEGFTISRGWVFPSRNTPPR
jgi:hypothetical protein